jgi:hypothetical protein
MTGLFRPSALAGFSMFAIATLAVIAGCEPTCDSVPTQSLAHIRIVNAVGNVPVFAVIIDHNTKKVFDSVYFEMASYRAPHQFGYRTKYMDRVSNLTAGTHILTLLDAAGTAIPVFDPAKNTMDTNMSIVFSGKDETIIFGGLRSSTTEPVHMLHLQDELRRSDTSKSLLRFVQVGTDIPGIDLFFYNKNQAPTPPANLSLAFPQITYQDGSGKGTGTSRDDYVSVKTADTTLITVSGDLSVAGQIVKIPYYLSSHGLYGTVVIRGRGAPVDNQPTLSVLYIPDGPEFSGTWQINYQFYEVRLVNATRLDTISLLVHNPLTKTEQDQARGNVPQQEVVFNITEDSVSRYWRLTQDFHGTARFVVSKSHYDLTGFDSIPGGSNVLTMNVNDRYTFIETETNPLGGAEGHSIIMLRDSLSEPSQASVGRVRFVNASPDHSTITIAGVGQLQARGSILTADLAVGTQTLIVSDGTNSATITVSVSHDTPINVIFTAAKPGKPFPFTVADK